MYVSQKITRGAALLLVLAVAGCAGFYKRRAIQTASLDHNCPEDRISVIDRRGPTAVLDVCGRRRVYRDTGGQDTVVWMDVTQSEPSDGSYQPETPPRH